MIANCFTATYTRRKKKQIIEAVANIELELWSTNKNTSRALLDGA